MSSKRSAKNQAAIIPPASAKKSGNTRLKKFLHGLWLLVMITLALISWGYRLFDLGTIIGSGGMGDFTAYYQASQKLPGHQPIWVIGESAPFGPPITLIPFLPFLSVPLVVAQFAFSLLNALLYICSWHLIAKTFIRHFSLKKSFWWVGLTCMAWSFPVSYSLGAGNSMGIVTWGIANYLLSASVVSSIGLALAICLKLFPAVLLPLVNKKRSELIKAGVAGSIVGVTVLLSVLLWPSQWRSYLNYATHLFKTPATQNGLSMQNQSFASMLARLGVEGSWLTTFVGAWSIGMLLLVGFWMATEKPWKKWTTENRLQWGMRLLAVVLLVHPTPWQYYHAIFIPYILVQLAQKRFSYVPVLLLLSFNGAWLPSFLPGISLVASSQWFGLLLLIVIEFSLSKKSSIDQIIRDRGFFTQVAVS